MDLTLSRTTESDLEELFLFQLDPEANHLAAFTPADPGDKAAYMEKWSRIVANPAIHMQTIRMDDNILGSIARFDIEGEGHIAYWFGKSYWGQNIATNALRAFLLLEPTRPLVARVAFDNIGSQRVLEKCGFLKVGTGSGFANARQAEIEEYIYQLPWSQEDNAL